MNMYVANLGFHVTDDDLRRLFEPFGEVFSTKVITDRDTGRSRGFGFVEMKSDNEAKQAIASLDGKELESRAISVTIAKPKENRPEKRRW